MENFRFKALQESMKRKPLDQEYYSNKSSDYFGENCFNEAAIQDFLPIKMYHKLKRDIELGNKVDRSLVDQVAASIKTWAINKGASHYTHWFQPLTGSTAEKHDSFLNFDKIGNPIESFSGDQLIQQEPDASSLPSGGIRSTFEARGYTAWDPHSPAFIRGDTLCIPTIFISYTGEALDYKTPLLKSITALDKAATDIVKYFDRSVKSVYATLGWEQEYFLVDEALYNARPDLVLTGRTVFGHSSAKDQQLDDHYFGVIPERVEAFMKEFEVEAHLLGIPVKTRHNEVAPNQFECAPIFEEAVLAVDHNQLIMDLIQKVAKHHNFVALLHEKPFSQINGSGKHNNWSLATNAGENLLSPGKDLKSNFRFLVFLVNILKAVYDHSDLLRASIASAGNALRLGGNEAPPAIISAFIGSHLTKMLDTIEKSDKLDEFFKGNNDSHSINIPTIPEILLDNTDRNRTSPFAFTGNKFEFRAVGSSANTSNPMMVLNMIMANQLIEFKKRVDVLIKGGERKDKAILRVVKSTIRESKDIRFEGNNYGDEWVKEAAKRGLSNEPSTPISLSAFISEKTIAVCEKMNVLSKTEIHARYEIELEKYVKKLQIEARVIGDLARNHILPIAIQYQNSLIENVRGLKEVLDPESYKKYSKNIIKSIMKISEHMSEIQQHIIVMVNERKMANKIDDIEEKAKAYHEIILPYFDKIRFHVDKLELMIDDNLWPLPKYRELLFTK